MSKDSGSDATEHNNPGRYPATSPKEWLRNNFHSLGRARLPLSRDRPGDFRLSRSLALPYLGLLRMSKLPDQENVSGPLRGSGTDVPGPALADECFAPAEN